MFMTMKKIYCSPVTTLIVFEAEEKLLTISAGTTDPEEGGDPTGGSGNGNTPNPFGNSGAQSTEQPSWLTSEE